MTAYKVEIQKCGQILCPCFVMPGHDYIYM